MPRYIPEPTPTSDDVHELQRYINQELRRISDTVNLKVDGAYGGIFQAPGIFVVAPLTITPVLFDPFTFVIPERPDGVTGDPALGSLQILTPGNYMFSFTTTVVNIGPNEQWGFLLAKNGVSTGLGGEITPSNQTESVTVGFNIIDHADKGDIYTMLINSVTNSDADVSGSEFICNRVSEEF